MSPVCVDIVLASYNGEKFLRQQIESIRRQDHRHWRLWLRDDGSQDSTRALLEDFCRRDARIRWSPAAKISGNLGPVQSFSQLLEALPSDSHYFLLCDQDDVWSPRKISRLLATLLSTSAADQSRPLLAFSDAQLIDDRNRILSASQMTTMHFSPIPSPRLEEICAQNIVTGCTVMGNQHLARCALPIPRGVLMHDWWLALRARVDGKILYCPEALVAYRQHAENVSGGSRRKGLRAAWKMWQDQSFFRIMEARFDQMAALAHALPAESPHHQRVQSLLEIRQLPRRQRPLRALELGWIPQGIKRQILFLLALLLWQPRPSD